MKLPEVHELQLANDFRAFLVARRSLPVVASTLWYRVGSRDERHGETGLSHFLEHMMFKGTGQYRKGEIDLITSKLGGSNNAFTDSDLTAYHFSLAADRWEQALEIEASRMQGCLLDATEFDAEKSVVLEELAMGEDDPMRMLYQMVEALAFQVHPYHHPVIGWRQDLERLGAGAMRAYYQRHYGPNRAFLVAVGDFDPVHVEGRIRELFSDLPKVEPRAPVLDEPQQKGERRAVVRFSGNLSRLAIAAKTCRLGERDDFVLDMLSHVLANGRTSRLYRRLVHKERIATSVVAQNETRADPGLFWISAELHEGQEPARAEALVREELRRVVDEGVTRDELARTRTQLHSGFLFDEETVLDLALKLGRFEALAPEGWRILARVLPMFDEIRSSDLQRCAREYLAEDRLVVVWSVPERSARRAAKHERKQEREAGKKRPKQRRPAARAARVARKGRRVRGGAPGGAPGGARA